MPATGPAPMDTTTGELRLCPACLTGMPADYPHDHVEIDRAAAGDRDLFARMDLGRRRETVIVALARGASLHDLSSRLRWPYPALRGYLPDEHPQSAVSEAAAVEPLVLAMWQKGRSDIAIAARVGCDPRNVGKIRQALGLPTLPSRRVRPTVGAP